MAVEFETSDGTYTCERVQAAGGESASVNFECDPDAFWSGEAFVLYETPKEVTVRVILEVGSPQSETLTPTYKAVDKHCQPGCTRADLEMTLE